MRLLLKQCKLLDGFIYLLVQIVLEGIIISFHTSFTGRNNFFVNQCVWAARRTRV